MGKLDNGKKSPAKSKNVAASKKQSVQIDQSILKKLVESGEKDRLRSKLSEKLMDSSWREDVRDQCREIIKKNQDITLEELVHEMTPRSCDLVPHQIKKNLEKDITTFLEKEAQTD